MAANQVDDFNRLVEAEIASLEDQLQRHYRQIEEKTTEFAKGQEELLVQLIENHVVAERTVVYQKMLEKKEAGIKANAESMRKKLAQIDELMKKHRQSLDVRADTRNRSVAMLKRIVISEDLHFGNMRVFRAETKAKRAKIAADIAEARNRLGEKRREYDALADSLRQVQCPEISASVKREVTDACQRILKEGRRRLLNLKMENRTLWMKVNHNV